MRLEKATATAGTVAANQNAKTINTVYRLCAELQNLFAYFCDPLIPPEEKAICKPLIISTARKVATLKRGGL